MFNKKLRYGFRVFPNIHDVYGVPLDSMQTDDYDEFIEAIKSVERSGQVAKWRCPGGEFETIYEELYGVPPKTGGDWYPEGWQGRKKSVPANVTGE